MVVGAGALRFLHILGERVGREHHDGQRAQIIALALADAARGPRPFMTGIWISMSTTSKWPGSLASSASRASWPLAAVSAAAPRDSSSATAISLLSLVILHKQHAHAAQIGVPRQGRIPLRHTSHRASASSLSSREPFASLST